MRFKRVIYNNNEIHGQYIESILKYKFEWLLKCEFDDADIEIVDDILYWNSGIFYWGEWKWGVVRMGDFRYCIWHGGIFLNGKFNGEWLNGVFKNGTFKGKFIKGEMKKEKV